MMQLRKLFAPGKIGAMEVKNRIVMAPMGTAAADPDGYMTERAVDYYVERAKGGVGLIITTGLRVVPGARLHGTFAVWDDSFIPGLRKLTQTVHEHGTKIAAQINHSGKVLLQSPPAEKTDPIGPSAVPWVKTGTAPREATEKDIVYLVEAFAEAARRAKDAGFDAVEFHGAHGYLISSFISPFTNKRSDDYGGSLVNRARFPCEILRSAREKVGPDFPLILRISGCDFINGGITLEDTLHQAPLFVEAGANALHVSASAPETTEWQFLSYLWPDGTIVYLAEAVKKVVSVPIITVGKLSDPVLANHILENGKADFVAIGRGLLADPKLPNKAREGRLKDIRQCIYCNNCMAQSRYDAKINEHPCTVNPALMREREFVSKPTTSPKKVMVIGGGLAGMEAARVLAQRGHQVSLYEKGDKLGGQWNIASQQKLKEKPFTSVTDRMKSGLAKAGVSIKLNKEVTAELVRQIRPDAVVVATGATPRTPDIPGAAGKNVVQANDVITGKPKVGKSVVVIGGRLVGMEVADLLGEQGKTVSLVTLHHLGENGRPLQKDIYRTMRDRMIDHGVRIYPDSPALEIRDNGVYVANNRELLFLKADTVVLAVGAKPENKLAEEIRGVVPEVYAIGDCVEPRDALWAIREGAEIGRQI